jgi:hypothetical protein
MAALSGGSPPPYPFLTGDLYFLPKNWSTSVVLGPDLFEEALKRPITTTPPSITTTPHDGGLPSPLSYTLADDNPTLPSTHTQGSRQNLRERNRFRNDGWTEWEAVQLADEVEATQSKTKADWECWKEADKQREALDLQINGPFLFEWDDLSEEALRDADKRLRQRWNAYEQMRKTEMAILSHFLKSNKAWVTNPSPHYHQFGSQHAKESERMKQRRERRKKAGTYSSQGVGSGDNCTIYKYEGSTEEEDDSTDSNKANDKFADSVITGSGDFFVSSPGNNHEGGIESAIGGGGAQYEVCIGRDGLSLIPHNCFFYSSK